jgi:hypothetical protein
MVPPIHLLEDLRDLPRLIVRTPAIGLPSLFLIVVFGLFEASGSYVGGPTAQAQAFNWFIFPPPLIAPFVAGALTNRSSYLAGGIVGLVAAILFSFVVLTASFTTPAGQSISNDVRLQNVAYAVISSLIFGLAVGGVAGLCRRLAITVLG